MSFVLLVGTGCNNLLNKTEDNLSKQYSDDGKTYIRIADIKTQKTQNKTNGLTSRTIIPNMDVEKLTDIILKGASETDETMSTLAEFATFNDMVGKLIEIKSGNWNFELSAKLNGTKFLGTSSTTVEDKMMTNISFELNLSDSQGTDSYASFSITLDFEGKASKVRGSILNSENNPLVTDLFEKELSITPTPNGGKVTFASTLMPEFSEGTYTVQIDFIGGGVDSEEILNTYREKIRVSKGFVSSATRKISLNKLCTITYVDNGGILEDDSRIESYSRRTGEFSLPSMYKDGYYFAGWYKNADFSGEKVDTIYTSDTLEDLKLYAAFINTLDVDSVNGKENPNALNGESFTSIANALTYLSALDENELDWTIRINGTLKERKLKDTVNICAIRH